MGTHLWIFPPVPPPKLTSSTGRMHQADTHRGSSAGKAKGNLRKAMLHLSNNTRIMQFYLTDFIRGFPHPSASHEPGGQIKASGAHPCPSGAEESRGVAGLTQEEKEQSRDKAGFSCWSTSGLSSCLLTAPWDTQRHQSPGVLLFHHKTASAPQHFTT